jgi:hypothetical protein
LISARVHPPAVVDVLHRARQVHANARMALKRLATGSEPHEQLEAVQTAVVFGVATTHVLQKLRGVVDGFDDWWAPWRAQLSADKLMRYLYELRSTILKEGGHDTDRVTDLGVLNLFEDLGDAPPGAQAVYIGTEGVGWIVRRDDGTHTEVPVVVPDNKVRVWLQFKDCPREHLGTRLHDVSVTDVCGLYLAFLDRILDDADTQPWNLRT